MVSVKKISSFIALLAASIPTSAFSWDVSQLNALANEFNEGISNSFKVTEYPFLFMNTDACFKPNKTCAYTNPDSPYAFPQSPYVGIATQMAKTDAQVLIMETPPPASYFAITPYLFKRYYEFGVPPASGVPVTVQIFESLADSINMATIKTTGSDTPGVNTNTQLSVFVMTADANTYRIIRDQFVEVSGFPENSINQVVMPVSAAPLIMGNSPDKDKDTFMMMLRTAYPVHQSTLDDYIVRAPFHFMKLSPLYPRDWSELKLATPANKIPGSGESEAPDLASARDELVENLKNRYGTTYTIQEVEPHDVQTRNYVCMTSGSSCYGDNPDAVYTHDVAKWRPTLQDKVLIVGIDHVATGKATYINQAISDHEHQVGVAGASDVLGVPDSLLQGSALKMARITEPTDPRYATYSKLYALTIGYNCTGEAVCLKIPVLQTNSDGSIKVVGIQKGDSIDITARTYADPATLTRPSTDEIIQHRVFKLTRK